MTQAPYIAAGHGFDVGMDFTRARIDTPIELAPKEYAKPGCVVGYIAGDKSHPLGFMRHERVRVHVRKSAVVGADWE